MSTIPLNNQSMNTDSGVDPADDRQGVPVVTGSANAKGSWTQLIASTDYDCEMIKVGITKEDSTNETLLVDIGIGAASSEQVILANIPHDADNLDDFEVWYTFPVYIPAGTRVSTRVQCNDASADLQVSVVCCASGLNPAASRIECFNVDLSNTAGTTVDPGATANTYGSWVELVSSLDHDCFGFFIYVGDDKNSFNTTQFGRIQIAHGAASSETIIVDAMPVRRDGEEFHGLNFMYIPYPLAKGERVAVRARTSITNATDRLMELYLIGVI